MKVSVVSHIDYNIMLNMLKNYKKYVSKNKYIN